MQQQLTVLSEVHTIGDHWLGVLLYFSGENCLYFSNENRLESHKGMPRKAKAICGSCTPISLTFIVDLLTLLLIIYSPTKGKCFELGELGLTRESLKRGIGNME